MLQAGIIIDKVAEFTKLSIARVNELASEIAQ
jgi:hypothetical protein